MKKRIAFSIAPKTVITLFTLFILISTTETAQAQPNSLNYKVVLGGSDIGVINIIRKTNLNSTVYSLSCEVRKRIIWLYTVSEKQESEFSQTKLIRSDCFRKVNGKVKVNKQLTLTSTGYQVKDGQSVSKLNYSNINDNMLTIYFQEPTNLKSVYSDNFQQFLDIQQQGNSEYKIVLPDGNKNYYTYKNGICTKVKAEHSLFSVELILTTSN